ncbi:Nuclear pore complex protein Nup50 [Orchesella cincta]|uniref:Nuclear pore complex protein Nup50 n=1 Tax=Orchesella cincta TaxID=48709 RepID=A0A1D2MWS9_ORCCI|nr:Nuclear pore complex protein Nup50 [Orchesella cincta]
MQPFKYLGTGNIVKIGKIKVKRSAPESSSEYSDSGVNQRTLGEYQRGSAMPKRKALGPVDSSDGEDDAFYSFPSTPMQSPFPKQIPNNFHSSSTPKRLPPTSNLTTFSLSSNSSGTQLQTLAATSGLQNKSSMFALSTNQISSSVPPAPLVAKKPRSSEFTKSMRDLNNAFVSSCRASVSKNPTHSLVPLVKDYLHHSRVLMEKSRGKTVGENGPTTKLVNGITPSPPPSFKTLGEFFDDFERNFTESTAKDDKSESRKETNLNTSGAITNSNSLSAFLSSGKINNNFGLTMSSPKPASENFKAFGSSETVTASSSSTPSETTSVKTSMFMSSPSPAKVSTLTDINKSNTSNVLSPALDLGSSGPLKSLTSPALSTTTKAEPVKVSEPAAVTKPAPFSGFSFFSAPPQSTLGGLGSSAVTSSVQKNNEEEDGEEDDEPPKVEITQVTEDDAVYSARCKVFGMVDGKYKDKGVGMLYIKKLSGGKHQVVVRADNNLGTVILNILLQKSLPLDKKSAKDVMTIDVHGNNNKGMPILLRVKSEADATELLNKLKEYREMNNS